MTANLSADSVITSASGVHMPVIGLGTSRATADELEAAIDAALEAGYRHIDTAFAYKNEEVIGRTLKKWLDSGKIKREQLFITTKLPPDGMNEKYVSVFLSQSLAALQLSYLDLYLIHCPVGRVAGAGILPRDPEDVRIDMHTDLAAVWRAMEAEVDAGRAKAIGVSNFNSHQVDRLLKSCRIPPASNQVELHVHLQQKELQAWSRRSGVTLSAYAPLGSTGRLDHLKRQGLSTEEINEVNPLKEPEVVRIAQAHDKTPAQVLLRFILQLGVAVIPKSTNPDRIRQNIQVFDFELSAAEMAALTTLDKGEAGRKFIFHEFKGFEDHPEYPFFRN